MNLGPFLILIVIIIAGGATAMQAPTNARLAVAMGSPVNAAFVSFAVGTVALGILAAALHVRPDVAAAKALPAWAWIGGLYGCVFVITAAWAVPRYGAALTITLMVAGQLLVGLALDHFGALGVPRHPMGIARLAGVALVFIGVLVVRRF
ncbi:DMT family transporter [soil metagenome]